jgi:hypothetical protein
MKAFVDVRAARRLANSVKASAAKFRFQRMDGLEMGSIFPQPVGKPGLRENARWSGPNPVNLNEHIACHENPILAF